MIHDIVDDGRVRENLQYDIDELTVQASLTSLYISTIKRHTPTPKSRPIQHHPQPHRPQHPPQNNPQIPPAPTPRPIPQRPFPAKRAIDPSDPRQSHAAALVSVFADGDSRALLVQAVDVAVEIWVVAVRRAVNGDAVDDFDGRVGRAGVEGAVDGVEVGEDDCCWLASYLEGLREGPFWHDRPSLMPRGLRYSTYRRTAGHPAAENTR